MTQGVYVWSKTAASNSSADTSINWAEGQAPSSVNDSARAVMARLAEYRDDNSGALTTAGTSTAYTVTTNQVFASLALMDKQAITIVPHTTSGATPTLAVDGLTAKSIRSATGVSVATGALVAGTPYHLTYYNTAGEFIVDGAALASAVAAGSVTNAGLANAAAWTLKGNNTSGSAAPTDFTIDALTAKASPLAADEVPIWDAAGAAMKKATLQTLAAAIGTLTTPTVQRFTSGAANYTPTAGTVRIRVRMCAGGGGGGARNTNNGSNGGDTSFGSWTAIHGNGGATSSGSGGTGGTGGAAGTGTLIVRINGGSGQGGGSAGGASSANFAGGAGGTNPFGGAGASGQIGAAGENAQVNTGAGGQGGGSGTINAGSGGGAGEYVEFWVTGPGVTAYSIGAGGGGGAAGGVAGGNGAAGIIIVEEFYF